MTATAMNQDSAKTASITVCNPFDGESVGEVEESSGKQITAAVQRATTAANAFRHSTPAERRALLDALADEVQNDQDNLANLVCGEMGKTIREARNEARRAVNTLRLSGDAATFVEETFCIVRSLRAAWTVRRRSHTCRLVLSVRSRLLTIR